MGNMRLLHITAQKPDSTGSGVYLAEFAAACARAGCEQAVVAGIGPDDDPALPEGAAFFPVRFKTEELPFPVCGMSDEMPYRSTRYRDLTPEMVGRFDAAFSAAVRAAAESLRPDCVVCHHLYLLTSLVRRLLPDVPVTAVCHSTDVRQMRQHDLERKRILDAVRRLDAVFALHDAQKRDIVEVYGVDEGRIHVVGTGFNNEVFRAGGRELRAAGSELAPVARADGGVPRPLNLVYAGKVSRKKGVESLVAALDALPCEPGGVVLRIAGGHAGEAERRAILARAAQSRHVVEFLGKLSQPDLAREYRRADVFVLPSFFEGLPLVVVEALACGCSVVLTDLPGIRPWLDAQAPGAPVRYVEPPRIANADEPEPGDLPAFERRLARAIEDAARLPRARCDLSHLSWDALGARIRSVCADVARPAPPGEGPCLRGRPGPESPSAAGGCGARVR